ncbi:hypothetical protein PGT21_027083 [Puccinia graminis f. sp. tritici]|uniref:Uncharacterized protein n=1 Tax=Puccinia graminis f. sp. tritici TaxID=56615 RepID=A0A5B0MLT4_PUCGR|nr:hypothetical protein PGT21_027083 [Puccinia graminis f. sp. tritici]
MQSPGAFKRCQKALTTVGFEPTPEDRRTTWGTSHDVPDTSLRRRLRPLGHIADTTDNCMSLPRGATSGGFIGGFVRSHCAYCRSHARGFVKVTVTSAATRK